MDQREIRCYSAIFTQISRLADKLNQTKIRWASDPSMRPEGSKRAPNYISGIISDEIPDMLSIDEVLRYATEEHGRYFDLAWGKDGVEKYKATCAFFEGCRGESPIHLDANASLGDSIPPKLSRFVDKAAMAQHDRESGTTDEEIGAHKTVADCEGYIGNFKGKLEQLATHIERTGGAIKHQRAIIEKVMAFIKTELAAVHGMRTSLAIFQGSRCRARARDGAESERVPHRPAFAGRPADRPSYVRRLRYGV